RRALRDRRPGRRGPRVRGRDPRPPGRRRGADEGVAPGASAPSRALRRPALVEPDVRGPGGPGRAPLMIDTAPPVADARTDDRRTLWTPTPPTWPVVVAAVAAGLVIVGVSYRLAAEGRSAQLYYAVFWVGMLAMLVPTALRVVAAGAARRDR